MKNDITTAPRIGMGCWAIGGPFWNGEIPVGYSGTNDADSTTAVHAAWDAGVRVFDTSAVYGAGHSETLLGAALNKRADAIIVSKFGHSFDAETKQMTGPRHEPDYIRWSINQSCKRLKRDHIDTMLLHLNGLSVEDAEPVFDTLEAVRETGQIGSYGWSTDFPASLDAFGARAGFGAVQHSMNIYFDAPVLSTIAKKHGLVQLNRSPLAMGVLTGKFADGRKVTEKDIRSNTADWQGYFENGRASKVYLQKLEAVRELLTTGGRSLTQGALCWLLAHNPRNLPIPGAKNAVQAQENAAAMGQGPLPSAIMAEIETLIERQPDEEAKAR